MATSDEIPIWAYGCRMWANAANSEEQAKAKAAEMQTRAACDNQHYAWPLPAGESTATFNTSRYEVNIPKDAWKAP